MFSTLTCAIPNPVVYWCVKSSFTSITKHSGDASLWNILTAGEVKMSLFWWSTQDKRSSTYQGKFIHPISLACRSNNRAVTRFRQRSLSGKGFYKTRFVGSTYGEAGPLTHRINLYIYIYMYQTCRFSK